MVGSLCGRHTDKVEAAGAAPGVVFGKPELRGALQMDLLDRGQGFKGPLHTALCAGFHFHKYHGVPFPGHNVKFQTAAFPVSGEYLPPHAQKKLRGRFFSFLARPGRRQGVFCGLFGEEPQHSLPCSCSFFGSTLRKSRRWSGQGP